VEALRDSWGREIKSVRVSVTDKCNFRCTYCMPAEGLEWLRRDEILSFEEIARLVGVLARLGVDEVRLTGGEPLVRRDLPTLVGMLCGIEGVRDLSLTTNGVLLDRLAKPLVDAGLSRINVSLDTLNHVRFAEITRRDALDAVLRGLEEAERHPQLSPIKVNCVAVKGFTETEVPALAELARRYLRGHGPADAADLASWSGLPLRDARAGLAAIAGELTRDGELVDLTGRPDPPARLPARLLGAFDPYLMGWRERAFAVAPEHARRVHPGGGIVRATAIANGRAVGTWTMRRGAVVVAPFAPLPAFVAAALERDAADVARFESPAPTGRTLLLCQGGRAAGRVAADHASGAGGHRRAAADWR
jgi:uncharacterized Fe-S cluster-containing radical SAM superfamily protein